MNTVSKGNIFYPIALRKVKIVYKFGLSECIRVKDFPKKNLLKHEFIIYL